MADLSDYAERWRDGRLRRIEHFRMWPRREYREDHSILVAGCGTSQAARYALRYPSAHVVGIDVSDSSLGHEEQLKRRHGLANLELVRLAVEDSAELGGPFDQVVCTGVLHHTADPLVALAALRRVMAVGGVIQVMVYAPYGRAGVYMMQEYARRLGIRPSVSELDELARIVRALPRDHPLGPLVGASPDFGSPGALADALLNPRDRAFTVPAVLELLSGAGLRLGRWVRQAPYVARCGVMAGLPHHERVAALPLEEQYAAMELFRGTMSRHSLMGLRDDDPTTPVRFDESEWRDYVPMRTGTAVVVRENLPEGATAAVLNRAHTDPDLVMFLDRAHEGAFDLVDGARPLGEIRDDGADFFAQLWWQDLVVVDASAAGGASS